MKQDIGCPRKERDRSGHLIVAIAAGYRFTEADRIHPESRRTFCESAVPLISKEFALIRVVLVGLVTYEDIGEPVVVEIKPGCRLGPVKTQ